MALSAERKSTRRAGERRSDPVATATKIWAGAIVMLSATGYATKGATATGLVARGVAMETVDNTAGADGALSIPSEPGEFLFKNSAAGDLISRAEIGDSCYVVDDETVAKTDGTGTRSIAGKITDVDADGVWVLIGV